MAYFADRTPYEYLRPDEEAPGTVNIGWLERGRAFPAGETSAEFRTTLELLCNQRVKLTRGFHSCQFCRGRRRPHGSAEVRVVGAARVYAAPELVYHYVAAHSYRPPDEFISAVLTWSADGR